ncbi:MAG: N-acetylmuramoyl-L-alanine amidase [Oscillospiraceae bacterium]|nr:N-acetylmuramoyl-L-alanine amidase [Oscillospiraceae bacterium]
MTENPKPPVNVLIAQPTNRWSRSGQKIEYIVLHYVGAVSTAKANAVYLNRDGNLGWSAHFFTDETSIWQSVPLTESAGHCGVDYSGGTAPFWGRCRNKNSIGIEMCCKRDAAGNWYLEPETVENTARLVRWLMQEHGVDLDHVVRHYDVCHKTCPEPWVRNPAQWQAFRNKLREGEKPMIRYNTVAELPEQYRSETEKLIRRGALRGRAEGKLDVSEDMLRTMLVCQRMVDEREGSA